MAAFIGFARIRVNERLVSIGGGIDECQFHHGRRSIGDLTRMQIHILKSKIHRATVTGASLNYEGSLTIDLDLMDKVGLVPYERVLCSNLANGARFETYLIAGERGSREFVLNVATAHL